LASYRFCDCFSASAGVANTVSSTINGRAQGGSTGVPSGPLAGRWQSLYDAINAEAGENVTSQLAGTRSQAESYKTYMGSMALTAPESMGFLKGSTLYAGIVNGYNSSVWGSGLGADQTSYYVGATIATPVTGLRLGAAFDYVNYQEMSRQTTFGNVELNPYGLAWAGYVSFQATEKLSFHGRLEYTEQKFGLKIDGQEPPNSNKAKIVALTGTVQYDLWKNVISRLELRWDHSLTDTPTFGGSDALGRPTADNAWMLAANVIYKF
jgi:hypothetical protein